MDKVEQILQYIDDSYRWSYDRPRMKYYSIDSYEDIVFTLEDLRDFILDLESTQPFPRSTYSYYLGLKGFDAQRFTSKYKETHPEIDPGSDEAFHALTDFLIEYLECGRKARTEDKDAGSDEPDRHDEGE